MLILSDMYLHALVALVMHAVKINSKSGDCLGEEGVDKNGEKRNKKREKEVFPIESLEKCV